MFSILNNLNFLTVSALRYTFCLCLVLIANSMTPLSVNLIVLNIAIFLGIFSGSFFAFSRIKLIAILLAFLVFTIAYKFFIFILSIITTNSAASILTSTVFKSQFDLILSVTAFLFILSFLFWRNPIILTLECVLIIVGLIGIFSAHREYRFDLLPRLTEWAWAVGLSHLEFIVYTGVLGFILISIYVFLSTLPGRPTPEISQKFVGYSFGKPSLFWLTTILTGFALMIFLLARAIYLHHSSSVFSNGVRQETGQGISPLDFHSALGSSSQPAALVRLEGDYQTNPLSPLLYFRESALSLYQDNKMVLASREFDRDLSFISPKESFVQSGNPDQVHREPLTQSIYLLADHKLAFTIDYPLSINPLKIENKSKKFKSAYRAYSMVPTYSPHNLYGLEVGNPDWSEKIKKHYLSTNPDSRYTDMAINITKDQNNPLYKAFAIIEYLNNHAIYTLTPNHTVAEGEDPTSHFLFGDMRGYCVHFAHATVYMLRALGIPARIGTGYMTDLSQSRDGHILLRMNDRHAWAEVYIDTIGWIPFDTQPKQVENHGETAVDMNLLEELMGYIEPGKEILPEDILKEEKSETVRKNFQLQVSFKWLKPTLIILILLLYLIKFYLWEGWRFSSSNASKLVKSYRAVLARLEDLTITRNYGETKEEYRARIAKEHNLSVLNMTKLVNYLKYSANPENFKLNYNLKEELNKIKTISLTRRILSLFNPNSAINFLKIHY